MKVSARGFTLIELLVVISIIGVLSTIGLISYKVLMQNSRDGKRQADLGVLQSSLEQYHTDQFSYPLAGTSCGNGSLVVNCPLKDTAGQKTYLTKVTPDPLPQPYPQYVYRPLDRTGGNLVNCQAVGKCTTYCIFAVLENNSGGVIPSQCSSYNPDSSRYNFAVSPP